MTSSWKIHVQGQDDLISMYPFSYDYILFPNFNVIRKYITGNNMLTSLYIFAGVISSTFASDAYGLIWHILYPFFVRTYFNVTVPLVQHCVITNGGLFGVSLFYAAWLLIMTSSLTSYLWSTLSLIFQILYLLIYVKFFWRMNFQSTLCFIGRIISQPNTNWPRI